MNEKKQDFTTLTYKHKIVNVCLNIEVFRIPCVFYKNENIFLVEKVYTPESNVDFAIWDRMKRFQFQRESFKE